MSCQTKPYQLPDQPLCHYEFMFNLCLLYHLLSGKRHSSSARFVIVSTVKKSRHSPVKGADPKEALFQVKNESRNLHCGAFSSRSGTVGTQHITLFLEEVNKFLTASMSLTLCQSTFFSQKRTILRFKPHSDTSLQHTIS